MKLTSTFLFTRTTFGAAATISALVLLSPHPAFATAARHRYPHALHSQANARPQSRNVFG